MDDLDLDNIWKNSFGGGRRTKLNLKPFLEEKQAKPGSPKKLKSSPKIHSSPKPQTPMRTPQKVEIIRIPDDDDKPASPSPKQSKISPKPSQEKAPAIVKSKSCSEIQFNTNGNQAEKKQIQKATEKQKKDYSDLLLIEQTDKHFIESLQKLRKPKLT